MYSNSKGNKDAEKDGKANGSPKESQDQIIFAANVAEATTVGQVSNRRPLRCPDNAAQRSPTTSDQVFEGPAGQVVPPRVFGQVGGNTVISQNSVNPSFGAQVVGGKRSFVDVAHTSKSEYMTLNVYFLLKLWVWFFKLNK